MEHIISSPLDKAALLVGGRTALASLLGISATAIGNWKTRGVPLEHCVPIERATQGGVTRKDLRPADYLDIWPELAGLKPNTPETPASPAQAAIKNVAAAPPVGVGDGL